MSESIDVHAMYAAIIWPDYWPEDRSALAVTQGFRGQVLGQHAGKVEETHGNVAGSGDVNDDV